MKKKYDPIRVPVCRCGRSATFFSIKAFKDSLPKSMSIFLRINGWVCGCTQCGVAFSADTKRAAVAAFEKEVEIDVGI